MNTFVSLSSDWLGFKVDIIISSIVLFTTTTTTSTTTTLLLYILLISAAAADAATTILLLLVRHKFQLAVVIVYLLFSFCHKINWIGLDWIIARFCLILIDIFLSICC